MARQPVVAGQFYPADAARLRSAIRSYTPEAAEAAPALGVLSPHAGYTFSGPVAGRTFAQVAVPDTVLLLTPSHSFDRPALALWTGGAWGTPLGEAAMHEALTEALAFHPLTVADDRPHLPEHSGEVVVPFLQYHNPQVRLAVICVTATATREQLKQLGASLPGLLADAALIIYCILLLGAIKLINQVLTLPGILAVIISIGMAVDANIIIFERLKEEIRTGKTMRSAVEAAFKRAWAAIFDSNVCSIGTGIVLAAFGTGPIKGFAVTLIVGVAVSLFTAVTISRLFMNIVVDTPLGRNMSLFGVPQREIEGA